MKKSILKGTLALTVMGAAALTSCTKEGEGKDVRHKVSSDDKEQKADSHEGKCGGMKHDDGSEKSIEMKCGEGKCGEGMCGGSDTKTTDHKCGEGKCGEGKCGGTAEEVGKTIDRTVSDVKNTVNDVKASTEKTISDVKDAANTTANDIENAAKDIKKEAKKGY